MQPPSTDAPDWAKVRIELEAMHKADQSRRREFNLMQETARAKGAELDKEAVAAAWKEIGRLDGSNQKRVAEIIDAHGWPKQSEVGLIASQAAFLVVQHADLEYQLKYLDRMRAAAASGDLGKSYFALLEDRVLIRQGKPQRYGSQVDSKGGVGLLSVEDDANLDSLRAGMDLEPICDYLKRFVKALGPVVYPRCAQSTPDNNPGR